MKSAKRGNKEEGVINWILDIREESEIYSVSALGTWVGSNASYQ